MMSWTIEQDPMKRGTKYSFHVPESIWFLDILGTNRRIAEALTRPTDIREILSGLIALATIEANTK